MHVNALPQVAEAITDLLKERGINFPPDNVQKPFESIEEDFSYENDNDFTPIWLYDRTFDSVNHFNIPSCTRHQIHAKDSTLTYHDSFLCHSSAVTVMDIDSSESILLTGSKTGSDRSLSLPYRHLTMSSHLNDPSKSISTIISSTFFVGTFGLNNGVSCDSSKLLVWDLANSVAIAKQIHSNGQKFLACTILGGPSGGIL